MAFETIKYGTKRNNLFLRAAKGHFATSDRHCNYYIDVVAQKARLSEAHAIAKELHSYIYANTVVDTVLCLDGTEVIGTCLADQLTQSDYMSVNAHNSIYVIEPEMTSTNMLLFRDNIVPMIKNKNVLLVAVSYSSGRTVESAAEAVQYYGGNVTGVCTILSAIEKTKGGVPIYSCLDPKTIGDYGIYKPHDCPLCKEGKPIDALINGYGYSKLK